MWEFGWAYGVGWGAAIFLFGGAVLLLCDKESEEIYYKERKIVRDDIGSGAVAVGMGGGGGHGHVGHHMVGNNSYAGAGNSMIGSGHHHGMRSGTQLA